MSIGNINLSKGRDESPKNGNAITVGLPDDMSIKGFRLDHAFLSEVFRAGNFYCLLSI